MNDSIIIENVKGIKHIEYFLPPNKGVYLLTGENGTGKTTLLAAINRIGDRFSFKHNIASEHSQNACIIYNISGKKVKYAKGKERWVPSPKTNAKILNDYKYHSVYYLTATGIRLYRQENHNLTKTKHTVSENLKNALNMILNTNRFSNLQYIKVISKKGRQQSLHRNNKLYVLKDDEGHIYSEIGFSLGEQLLLNALDYIEDVSNNAMLVIDEIELALHPIAQVRFYEYLVNKAKEKDLAVIISTHSSTLIKKANCINYLENENGNINVIYNCSPAYILKDLSIEEDNKPDIIILVEDKMAKKYVYEKIKCLRKESSELQQLLIRVVEVGGYEQVLTLFENLSAVPPFSKSMIHCLLDNDVNDTITAIKAKESKTDSDKKKINQFDRLARHYNYLSITPELGVWSELESRTDWFNDKLIEVYGPLHFSIDSLVKIVRNQESATNPRDRAKKCFKNLYDKLHDKLPDLSNEKYHELLFSSYVSFKWRDDNYKIQVKSQLFPIIHK